MSYFSAPSSPRFKARRPRVRKLTPATRVPRSPNPSGMGGQALPMNSYATSGLTPQQTGKVPSATNKAAKRRTRRKARRIRAGF